MHPEAPHACSGEPIASHTLARSGVLKRIARDGKVYQTQSHFHSIYDNDGVVVPRLRGISTVSVFPGFCPKHDKLLFAPVEDEPITFTPEQVFLIGFRDLTRELFLKEKMLRGLKQTGIWQGDMGDPACRQLVNMMRGLRLGTLRAISRLKEEKAWLDSAWRSRAFDQLHSYTIEIEPLIPVVCSAIVTPAFGFDGNRLANIKTSAKEFLGFCLIPTVDRCSTALFSWDPKNALAVSELLETFERVPAGAKASALVRFALGEAENCAIAPVWWDQLDGVNQRAIITLLNVSTPPETERGNPHSVEMDELRSTVLTERWSSRRLSQ
jgi:hypothetical protein